ncbi:hypothetical protein D3C80_472020 [compost metagenome]
MHCGHLVEEQGLDQLQPGLEQLGPNDHGHGATGEEHGQGEQQIEGADIFVIRGV